MIASYTQMMANVNLQEFSSISGNYNSVRFIEQYAKNLVSKIYSTLYKLINFRNCMYG